MPPFSSKGKNGRHEPNRKFPGRSGISKLAPRNTPAQSAKLTGSPSPARLTLPLSLRRALILGAACLFLALGIMTREPLTVLNKAIYICLDCIGMAP